MQSMTGSSWNRRRSILGAGVGLLFGLAIFGVLRALASSKGSPGGPSEDRMWLGLFASLWGMPLSGLLDLLAPNKGRSINQVAIVLVVNWMILGGLLGTLLDWRTKRSVGASG